MSKPRFKRPAAKPFDIKDAAFVYTSDCCGFPAIKPSVTEVSKENEGKGTLGKFRCPQCKHRCSVTRSKNVKDQK